MRTEQFSLSYGTGRLQVSLPADNLEVVGSRPIQAVGNPESLVQQAIDEPVDSPALGQLLAPSDSVCILVSDATRLTGSDVFLPVLVREMNRQGVPCDSIFILFSNGLHRKMSPSEHKRLVGHELAQRMRMFDHDSTTAVVRVGQTGFGNEVYISERALAADRIIMTGGITAHHFAGYTGGRKSILPGIAGRASIHFNHQLMFHPRAQAGVLDGNPVHEDALQACGLVTPCFLVNTVLDPSGRIARVVAGQYDIAHALGCEYYNDLYRTAINGRADVVVVSCGGHPRDIDLRQAKKSLHNALAAVKKGGHIVLLAECSQGITREGDDFYEWMLNYPSTQTIEEALLKEFSIGGMNAYRVKEATEHAEVHIVSSLPADLVARMGMNAIAEDRLQATVDQCLGRQGVDTKILLVPEGSLTLLVPAPVKL